MGHMTQLWGGLLLSFHLWKSRVSRIPYHSDAMDIELDTVYTGIARGGTSKRQCVSPCTRGMQNGFEIIESSDGA